MKQYLQVEILSNTKTWAPAKAELGYEDLQLSSICRCRCGRRRLKRQIGKLHGLRTIIGAVDVDHTAEHATMPASAGAILEGYQPLRNLALQRTIDIGETELDDRGSSAACVERQAWRAQQQGGARYQSPDCAMGYSGTGECRSQLRPMSMSGFGSGILKLHPRLSNRVPARPTKTHYAQRVSAHW